MKNLILLLVVGISTVMHAQSNFETGMTKAFELWKIGKTDEAENRFERIAQAEPQEWLPHYYIAQINSLKSWTEKDAAVLKAQLDKAQKHLDLAQAISENNPELLIMQAQVLTNWVVYDGMTYGMKYSAQINSLYHDAYTLDPTNPRAAFCKADWAMGSAKYFGKDTAPYCEDIEAALNLFDTFKPKSAIHPNWGKERALRVAKQCKS